MKTALILLIVLLGACAEPGPGIGSDAMPTDDESDAGTEDTSSFDAGTDDSADADGTDPDLAGMPVDTGSDTSAAPDLADPFCAAIPPSADPSQNHANILDCLTTVGEARLADGTFPIDDRIVMPDDSRLIGNETYPTLALQTGQQSVVELHDRAEVAFLRLDANHNLTVPHGAILYFRGDDGFAHDNHVQSGSGPVGEEKVTGVRFWFDEVNQQSGNRAFRNQIHDVHYGVIFDQHPNGTDNLLEANQIHDIRCDGVSFRGYGRAVDNELYRLGRQCLNPVEDPIPGGGFYTLDNPHGAEIVGNHAYQTCGMPLDLDRARNFVITDNTFEQPGFTGAAGYGNCGAGATSHLVDISESTIERNTFRKGAGPVGSDPNRVMSASGNGVPSDLPAGADTAVAFILSHRRDETTWTATHNSIRDNSFIANCTAPCVGLGYFTGRGTGFDLAGNWSASTTNYFTNNTPFGSNIGSKRCGGNWYAANSACGANADPDCNADDAQHEGAGHDQYRNDNCQFYP